MNSLHQLFQARADEAPEREAVVGDGLRWTYGELADRVRRLAGTLQRLGVGPEVPVGICTRRAPEMVAGMLGALEAGGAYLPLDPRYPRERLRFMLEDAEAPVVLTDAGSAAALPETGARRLFLDRPEAWEGEPGQDAEPDPRGLAYLIYTSGSTGRPKGVAIPHAAAAHLMHWARDAFSPEELEGVLAATSICFDLSVFEIFAPLSWGGRVILAENALALSALAAAGEVTLVNTVPSAAAELARNGEFPPSVRTINLAGEALQRSLVDQLYRTTSARAVFNLYGPSEDTTYSTWVRVPPDETSPPTIGVPLPEETAYVLGPDWVPVPDGPHEGEPGELYLGGPALARGYLGRPDLTAERFLPDPFSSDPGARMYRTGDLVRLRPDGELDFLGRIDHQVKIRGFRIELGEVEAALLAAPGVAECVVVARQEETGARLVAYAAPEGLSVPELRRHLKERLPEHMVPPAVVLLPFLPRTPNGKVDRKALPAPVRVRPEVGAFVAPRKVVEERLAALWAEALGLEAVGVEDDFFELGGHSLIAGRLFSRIRQAFGAEVSLRDLFETPTVAGFAARLGPGRALSPIAGAAGAGEPPLSFGQERLLFLQRMEAEPITYNVPILGTLAGPLDVEALGRAFTEIVRRHEPLRTVFASKDGREVQVVLPPEEVPIPIQDGTSEDVERLAQEEFRRPLDLDRGPLIRVLLLRLGAFEHRLLLTVHHIAWDDGSLAVLLRELPALYRGETLPPLPARYADFAAWQRARFQGAELEESLDRWARRFQDLPQPVELPADRPRPATAGPRGGEWLFEVPQDKARALRGIAKHGGARRDGATLFMASLALFQAWLLRLTGQTDLSVIAPVSTRTRVELEPLVGFFVNNLFVRTDLGGDPTFAELVGRAREAALAAFEHQELPFDLALRRLHPGSPAAVQALLRVIFALHPEVPRTALTPDLDMTLREVGNGTAKADLAFFLEDRADGGMDVRMEYSADLFEASTVQRMGGFFLTLLDGVAADPDRRLSGLSILSAAQRAQILVDWNDTAVPYPREACIHELIEEHSRRAPEALALRWTGGEMTYAELDARAEALAEVLAAEGVGPDQLVGLCLERSPEAIVAIVAILKAGGAFAPLDPAYPEDRLAFMLEDTAAPVLITRRRLLGRLPSNPAKVICWEDLPSLQSLRSFVSLSPSPDNLAYVMYTSGSTGRPKGVAVTHRDVVRLARSSRFADFGTDHVFLHMGPLSFDATTLEVGYSLLNGSAMAVLPPETPSLQELGEFLVSQGVTAAWITAGLFQQMVESQLENLSKLRLILSGGDVLSPAHVARVLEAAPTSPSITVVNGYGPTESTVFTSCHPMRSPAEVESPLPIGRPIGNTRVAVVDRQLQLAPPGVEGELWIGGDGLARGYLHRPELTAERFVPDPFWGDGERLYRTGDLVRWRADGLLEFLGRVDFQVKLRGFRVELEEIEAALASHPEVSAASVVVQGEGGDKRLVAFWTGEASEPDFRAFLGGRLPSYMVPAAFVRLDALPLNANGKVDRKALARIEPVLGPASPETEAPRNATEELLAGIWAEVLGLERIGIRDDFFDLGGHSLLILRVLSRVREAFGADLVPRDVFDAPTVAGLAERLETRRIGRLPPVVPVSRESDLPLSYAQHRLWFLERLGTRPGTYNVPVAFRLRGELDVPALRSALAELARRHETLRTTFPLRDGEPVQAVAGPTPVPMPLIDLSGIDEREAWRLGREEASAPFDLEAGPLLRTRLIRLAPDDHLWLVNLHHIVTDGWSRGVFVREVSRLYAGESLPGLPVQYADYSAWQRQWLESGVIAEQLAWWARRLDRLESLDLPTDRPRPSVQTFRGASYTRRLPELGPPGGSRRATRFMALLAVPA
ncbi:MAG: amino acid adenylation domain-containing protein, partial [Acidobacteriota bacterium]